MPFFGLSVHMAQPRMLQRRNDGLSSGHTQSWGNLRRATDSAITAISMTQRSEAPSPRWAWGLAALATLLTACMAWLTVQSIVEDRRAHDHYAHTTVRNLSLLLEREVHAELDQVDLVLQTVAQAISRHGTSDWVRTVMDRQRPYLPPGTALAVLDARAQPLQALDWPASWAGLREQEFFIRLRGSDEPQLRIALPLRAPDGAWQLPLARRLPGEAFSGAVVALVPLKHYTQRFADLQLGPRSLVALRSAEHRTVVRHPELRQGPGSPGQFGMTDPLQRLLQTGQSNFSYVALAPSDQHERVFGYAQLRHHPLYVIVGLSTQDYLATWWRNTAWTLAIALVYLLGTAAFAWLALRAWSRQQQAERLWSSALDASGFGVFQIDLRSQRLRTARRSINMLGYAEGEIGDMVPAWLALVHPQDRQRLQALAQAHLDGTSPRLSAEVRLRRKDGGWKWLHLRGQVTGRDREGRPLQLVGTYVDIDERRQREEELRLASTVFQMANEGMVITDADNRIVSVNPAFTAITGYEPADVIGHNPRLLSARTHSRAFYQDMWQQLLATGAWTGEVLNRRKSGEVYVEWLSIRRITDKDGQPTHHVAVFTDITERKASEQRIQHLALHDALTDLPNRALLRERLEQALLRAQRNRSAVGLIYFDLDRFKPVNDAHGHEVGDQLLKAVAQRVLGCIRASDTLARLGGDEFVILLPDTPGAEAALEVARKVLAELQRPFEVAGLTLEIAGSLGVALYPEHGPDGSTLLRHADAAMYQAKQQGRGRVALYTGPTSDPPGASA